MFICSCLCVNVCVTWGHNFTQDSFIKCGGASKAAVLFAVCWGSALLTPQDPDTAGMDWLAFAFAAVLLLVVKGDLFLHRRGSPEEMERLLMRFCKTEFSLESLLQE